MKSQKYYNTSDIELICNFLEVEKGLLILRFDIICTINKFWEDLKIKIKIGKWLLGLVEICLKLKWIFGNSMVILENFKENIGRKIEKRGWDILGQKGGVNLLKKKKERSAHSNQEDDTMWGMKRRSQNSQTMDQWEIDTQSWYFHTKPPSHIYKYPIMHLIQLNNMKSKKKKGEREARMHR